MKATTMTLEPTLAELQALRLAENQLICMEILVRDHAYDLDTLAVAIYDLGGAYAVDREAGGFFATIRPQQQLQMVPRGEGVGWTAESALVFALLQASARPSSRPIAVLRETDGNGT